MRIRIDDPAALPDLVEELASRVDAVITEVKSSGEVELWLLGSRTVADDREEIERRLENRQSARHARVWIVD
jgi:CRISPR/Cas system-associated endonuclease/helicase Cas3